MNPFTLLRCAALATLLSPACFATQTADYELINARIFQGRPDASTGTVAIAAGRILAVGNSSETALFVGTGTKIVDLGGRWLLPGFNDAHLHFLDGALSAYGIDVTTPSSSADVPRMVGAFAKTHPDEPWILGAGWSHTNYPGRAYPARQDIDAAVSDRPVLLEHVDGHLIWANSLALQRAGVTKKTKDPPNGEILRDPKTGEPTGILLESAMSLVWKAVPQPSAARRREALLNALARARSLGVTSIQGMLDKDGAADLSAWRAVPSTGVTVRYFIWGTLEHPEDFLKLKKEFSDLPADRFVFGGAKGFVDGVISARTAALLEPYSDAPSVKGTPNYTQKQLNALVLRAKRLGLKVELHAIGDRAVRMALDSFENARNVLGPQPFRDKVEHIELVDPADIPRFKALDVVASMQPSHCTYENQSQNYNDERLGPQRARFAFAWRSLQEAGAPLAFGTDWPVMPLDPRVGLFAAATRENFDGKPPDGWVPEQKISLEDAISHYTRGSAYAESMEKELGSILPGMRADLVVMGAGLFEAKGTQILRVPVDAVFFDGRPVFVADDAPFKDSFAAEPR